MKSFFLILLICITAFAVDWDEKFKDVCKRDSFCTRLKASDGTWLRPKPEIIALMKSDDVQKTIKESAQKYGVDPTAVAGAIVAENSLNVGVKDSVQTFLASKMGITSIAGKSFSFGLGQINLEPAMEAEYHIAKIEKRAPRSQEEMIKEIADPIGSIRVAASIVRKVQDDYKEQGFDISKDPAILTTLYNLGKSEQRAKEAKAAGRLPQSNYFGLFVEKYTPEIKTAAKLNVPVKTITPASKPVVAAAVSEIKPSVPVVTKPAPNKKLVHVDYVTRSVPLVSAPMLCDSEEYGQNPARETKSTSFGAPLGSLDKGQTFKEVSRGLDCKSNVWKLVKGNDGQTGWVQEEKLNEVKSSRLDSPIPCEKNEDKTCQNKISSAAKDYVVPTSKTQGLVYLKPVTADKSKAEASFKGEDFHCNYAAPVSQDQRQYGRTVMISNSSTAQFSVAELKAAAETGLQKLEQESKRMSQAVGISQDKLSSPDNPYSSVSVKMDQVKVFLQGCLNSLQTEMISCAQPKSVDEFMQSLVAVQYQKEPQIKDVMAEDLKVTKAYVGIANFVQQDFYSPSKEEMEETSVREIKEAISDCSQKIESGKASLAAATTTTTTIPPQQIGYGGVIMNVMGMYGGGFMGWGGGLSPRQISEGVEKASDENIQKFKSTLITYAKYCHAKLNLISPSDRKNNRLTCAQSAKHLVYQYQTFSRDLVAKTYQQNPELLYRELERGAANRLSPEAIQGLGIQPATPKQIAAAPMPEMLNPYCPNRTAEFIEDLLKSNPCIKRVYVPTRYLSNKLSSLVPKVIYRKFEEDGKYAVEYGDSSCK